MVSWNWEMHQIGKKKLKWYVYAFVLGIICFVCAQLGVLNVFEQVTNEKMAREGLIYKQQMCETSVVVYNQMMKVFS